MMMWITRNTRIIFYVFIQQNRRRIKWIRPRAHKTALFQCEKSLLCVESPCTCDWEQKLSENESSFSCFTNIRQAALRSSRCHTHTHPKAHSPWIVQAPCVYKNLKKAFHAIFYLHKLFYFCKLRPRRRRPNAHHRHITRQDKFFFLCLQKQVFSSTVPCLATSRKTWLTWRTILLALGSKRILYA